MAYPTSTLDVGPSTSEKSRAAHTHAHAHTSSFSGIQPLLDLRLNKSKCNAVEILSLKGF